MLPCRPNPVWSRAYSRGPGLRQNVAVGRACSDDDDRSAGRLVRSKRWKSAANGSPSAASLELRLRLIEHGMAW